MPVCTQQHPLALCLDWFLRFSLRLEVAGVALAAKEHCD